MKKILITGANSYIGTSFENYMSAWSDDYQIDTVDMIGEGWHSQSFIGYDSVFHVAGIAHISTKRLDQQTRERYWNTNALLPVQVAKKAKAEGVGQFIFLSSMSVYGEHGSMKHPVVITKDTLPTPRDIYGQSKLAAEEGLEALNAATFAVAILRPPMVYGPGCKGNYQHLVKAARIMPFFPDIDNQRSMLQIDRLSSFVRAIIEKQAAGLFFPQDDEYVNTTKIVAAIAQSQGKSLRLTKVFNPALRILSGKMVLIDKVFGSLVYNMVNDERQYYTEAESINEDMAD